MRNLAGCDFNHAVRVEQSPLRRIRWRKIPPLVNFEFLLQEYVLSSKHCRPNTVEIDEITPF